MQRILQLSPDKIGVRPALFQFKSRTDSKTGVSGILNGATWNPICANTCLVWQPMFPREGEPLYFIVDGHQRCDLARRAVKAGMPGVYLCCRVLLESKGVTPAKAKIQGAIKNICENGASTKPYDIATLFRAGGDLSQVERYLSNYNRNVQCAKTLMNSDDWLFRKLADLHVDDYVIADVFEAYPDDLQRWAALQGLEAAGITNRADPVLEMVKTLGFDVERSQSLFGEVADWHSKMEIAAKLLRYAIRHFKGLSRAYGEAVQSEEALTSVGNVLTRERNVEALQRAEWLSRNISRISVLDKATVDLIKACVSEYENSPERARSRFVDGISKLEFVYC